MAALTLDVGDGHATGHGGGKAAFGRFGAEERHVQVEVGTQVPFGADLDRAHLLGWRAEARAHDRF